MWLCNTVISAHVELFVVEARSAEHQKAPQAGSTESLMFLSKGKELFSLQRM